MTGAFAWGIKAYGQRMICCDREGTELSEGMALVQPMTGAEWHHSAGALGSFSTERFRCLAEPHLPLSGGGVVEWCGSRYEVMNVRPIRVGNKVTHLWAVLRPAEEAGL